MSVTYVPYQDTDARDFSSAGSGFSAAKMKKRPTGPEQPPTSPLKKCRLVSIAETSFTQKGHM